VSGSDDEASTYWAWLEARTRNLMAHPVFVAAVPAVVAALLERSTLSYADVCAVISDATFPRR
jgi:hypothetical protein